MLPVTPSPSASPDIPPLFPTGEALLHRLPGLGISILAWEFIIASAIFLAMAVVRVIRGDEAELLGFKIGNFAKLRALENLFNKLNEDDRTKKNVINAAQIAIRDLLPVISAIKKNKTFGLITWSRNTLAQLSAAVTRGGHDVHRASIWVADGTGSFKIYSHLGMEQSTVKSLRLPASSIVGIVYSRKKSYNCADVSKDPNYWESGHGRQYKSFVASPIADDAGGVKGVLCVDAQSEGYFDDDDVFFIELFADVLSVGMSCT